MHLTRFYENGVGRAVSSSPGSSPDRGHCVVYLGKTVYSHTLHPNAGGGGGGVTLGWTSIPSRGEWRYS